MTQLKAGVKAAQTLLQKELSIKVGRHLLSVPRPTYGTMVRVSEIVEGRALDTLVVSEDNIIPGVMRYAKESQWVLDALVVLLVGEKRLKFSLTNICLDIAFRMKHWTIKTPRRWVESLLRYDCTFADLLSIYGEILEASEIKDFFSLITFLAEASVAKPTKVSKTTVSGR